jgi:hypothetical protein
VIHRIHPAKAVLVLSCATVVSRAATCKMLDHLSLLNDEIFSSITSEFKEIKNSLIRWMGKAVANGSDSLHELECRGSERVSLIVIDWLCCTNKSLVVLSPVGSSQDCRTVGYMMYPHRLVGRLIVPLRSCLTSATETSQSTCFRRFSHQAPT